MFIFLLFSEFLKIESNHVERRNYSFTQLVILRYNIRDPGVTRKSINLRVQCTLHDTWYKKYSWKRPFSSNFFKSYQFPILGLQDIDFNLSKSDFLLQFLDIMISTVTQIAYIAWRRWVELKSDCSTWFRNMAHETLLRKQCFNGIIPNTTCFMSTLKNLIECIDAVHVYRYLGSSGYKIFLDTSKNINSL